MNFSIYLRPLQIMDAQTSCHWRNNPKLWRFTGSRPDRHITPEIETAWLTEVLKRPNEKRFAICVKDNDKYIGNIFLTNITSDKAEHHIFIGDMEYWGQRRADQAIILMLDHGFNVLGLDMIYAWIDKRNQGALGVVYRMHWGQAEETEEGLVKFIFTKQMFQAQIYLDSLQHDC